MPLIRDFIDDFFVEPQQKFLWTMKSGYFTTTWNSGYRSQKKDVMYMIRLERGPLKETPYGETTD